MMVSDAHVDPSLAGIPKRGASCRMGEKIIQANAERCGYAAALVQGWIPNHAGLSPRGSVAHHTDPSAATFCVPPSGPQNKMANSTMASGEESRAAGNATDNVKEDEQFDADASVAAPKSIHEQSSQEARVLDLSTIGCSADEIAFMLGTSRAELRQKYSSELRKGRSVHLETVRHASYEAACQGRLVSLSWLYKRLPHSFIGL
jgi:hypothetical protein